jgi:hypothetical protein
MAVQFSGAPSASPEKKIIYNELMICFFGLLLRLLVGLQMSTQTSIDN